MKILGVDNIRRADAFTIAQEPISSVDLMERAGQNCVDFIVKKINTGDKVKVFCGPGNNGGDGLVIAFYLNKLNFNVEVFIVEITPNYSSDFSAKLKRLQSEGKVKINKMISANDIPDLENTDVVIDTIFGSGLNRPVDGFPAQVIKAINDSRILVFSIDIPSGLFSDNYISSKEGAIVEADYSLSLEFPKYSMMMPENEVFVGDMNVISIGLHPAFITEVKPAAVLLEKNIVKGLLHNRSKFGHKGTYGHALLIAGSYDKTGAAILASGACLRAGAGLLTAHIPEKAVSPLQASFPEVMLSTDEESRYFSSIPDLSSYNAVAVGPGLGQELQTAKALKFLIQEFPHPVIFDADALNILSENKTWLSFIKPGSVFTPHLKEFERLAGKSVNHFERIEKLRTFAEKYGVFIILKGAHSAIACPDGTLYFNNTGNPGMATAGSGDVLTGILLGLMSQGYSSHDVVVLGAYLHGLAGDLALENQSEESLIASDITSAIGKAFNYLRE